MSLVDRTVRELLDAVASPAPTPGGGSASALASALGASLLMMVAAMPKTRGGTEEDARALRSAREALDALRTDLIASIDEDAAAYDRVLAAFKLPKGTPEEQQARRAAIQAATRGATEVPLRVMQLSGSALAHAAAVGSHGHRGAASDVGVGAALVRAGLDGARLNVEINLPGIADAAYAADARARLERFGDEGRARADAVEALLRQLGA